MKDKLHHTLIALRAFQRTTNDPEAIDVEVNEISNAYADNYAEYMEIFNYLTSVKNLV